MAGSRGIRSAGGKLAQGRGSGVSDLLRDMAVAREAGAESLQELDPRLIDPAPWQPRRDFNDLALMQLAEGIEESGLLQPPLVRPKEDGRYELLAGERRLRAVRDFLRRTSILVRVRDVDDLTARLVTRAENRDREDLTAWEDARELAGIRDAIAASGGKVTVRELARVEEISTGAVSEKLRIADHITEGVMERAGVDVQRLNALSYRPLLTAAKGKTEDERAALLHMAAYGALPSWAAPKRSRREAVTAAAPPPPGPPPLVQKLAGGGVRIEVPADLSSLDPADARKALKALRPVVASLRKLAPGEKPL